MSASNSREGPPDMQKISESFTTIADEMQKLANIPLTQLNESLNKVTKGSAQLHAQNQAIEKNNLARIENEEATTDDALLDPLVNIKDGSPITQFPRTLGELMSLKTNALVSCLEALGVDIPPEHDPAHRGKMDETTLKQYRRDLARLSGVKKREVTRFVDF